MQWDTTGYGEMRWFYRRKDLTRLGAVSAWFVLNLVLAWLSSCVIAAAECDRFPIYPSAPVREYMKPTGLHYREFDLDGDGQADYATATPEREELVFPPLFYAYGHEEPDLFGEKEPFMAGVVFIDRGGRAACEDIRVYWVRKDSGYFDPEHPFDTYRNNPDRRPGEETHERAR